MLWAAVRGLKVLIHLRKHPPGAQTPLTALMGLPSEGEPQMCQTRREESSGRGAGGEG